MRQLFIIPILILGLWGNQASAQHKCCSKANVKTCCSSASKTTSGCAPSACRGAQTKFDEAHVITQLRNNLIALKAQMETSKSPKFESRSYDIHDIVGETDAESIDIIVKELKVVETAFAQTMNLESDPFELPINKAKQILYLNARINVLQSLL